MIYSDGFNPGKKKSFQLFSIGKLTRQVIMRMCSDALQHPLTILSTGVCILLIIYLGLFRPSGEGLPVLILFTLLSAKTALICFFFRCAVRYKEIKHGVTYRRWTSPEGKYDTLSQWQAALAAGFSESSSVNGVKALEKLICQYNGLLEVLERKKKTGTVPVSHVQEMAEEILYIGLSVLTDALELLRTLNKYEKKRLEEDIARLEREIKNASHKTGPPGIGEAALLRTREKELSILKKRIIRLIRQQQRIYELYHQAGLCEASLEKVKLELAALRFDGVKADVNTITREFEKTLSQVKKIGEDMKK